MRLHAWCGALLLLCGSTGASAETAIYRCGNEYTVAPCRDGRVVDTQGAETTAARRAEAARVVASEKQLAEDMARDRRLAEARIKPALAGSLSPQRKPETDAKAQAKSTPKKKKSRGKARSGTDDSDDFVAQVPKAKKPA